MDFQYRVSFLGVISALLILSTPVFADHAHGDAWESFAGLGYIDYVTGTNNKNFSLTATETDSLAQSQQRNSVGYLLGFDKIYFLSKPMIHAISAGFTLRYDPATFKGQRYQYQSTLFNNYNYHYFVRPISALFETNIVFQNMLYTAPFIVAGAGLSAVNLIYNETVTAAAAASGTPAGSAINASTWTVAPEVVIGGGLKWNLKKHGFLKTQYLYQYRGSEEINNAISLQGVPVNLNEQSVDVIAGYRFQ